MVPPPNGVPCIFNRAREELSTLLQRDLQEISKQEKNHVAEQYVQHFTFYVKESGKYKQTLPYVL